MLGFIALFAGALTGPVELDWSAPPQCPTSAAVEARIESYVEDVPPDVSVRVEATVTESAEGWSLTLETTDDEGRSQQRVVSDPDCEALAEVTAVLTALAIDKSTEEREQAPPPQPEPALPAAPEETFRPEDAPTPPPVAEPPEDRPSPQAPAPDPLRLGVRVAGGFGLGWMPPGGDVGLAFTLGRARWGLEAEALLGAPRQVRLASLDGIGVDLLGWTAAVRGCGVVGLGTKVDLPLCGGVEAGQLRGDPVGLENATTAAPTWVALLVSPALRLAVHRRIALWFMPELQVGVLRPDLHTNDGEVELFASSIASGRVRAGVELVF